MEHIGNPDIVSIAAKVDEIVDWINMFEERERKVLEAIDTD